MVVLLALGACQAPTTSPPPDGTLPPPSTIVVTTTTEPRPVPLPLCEPPGYVLRVVPSGVTSPPDGTELQADRYTAIEGTSTDVFVNDAQEPRVVLIRGSLPPDDWAGRTVRLDIHGFNAALGPMPDGAWAVAWAESTTRCDQYSLIVYPPTSREEITVVAEGLERR